MQIPITHLGGEKGVTGSCHLMQVQGLNLLVDCGMTQGEDTALPIERWPVKPSKLDFIFLTHAHIDHIGLLPELIKAGFDGEIICSHPTKALLSPMLNDAMKFGSLAKNERESIERKIEDLAWGFEYRQEFDLPKGITFRLGRAGHILGSSFIRFDFKREGYSILFSGDLGNQGTPILPDPDTAEAVDLLILESTYGNRLHEGRDERILRLAGVLDHCLADGGKVYIPAFALGRTQEILFELDRIFTTPRYGQAFPNLGARSRPPVFIDSPLALEITDLYKRLTLFWDQEARELLKRGDHPLDFGRLFSVAKYGQHEKLNAWEGSAIIIAGSGMCTGGRIIDHLLGGIDNPKNDVLFVGYQAAGTPGRWIQQKAASKGTVFLDGRKRKIRAGVYNLSGYSAHADQKGLLEWVQAMEGKPKKIKLVHGEPEARLGLAKILKEKGYEVE